MPETISIKSSRPSKALASIMGSPQFKGATFMSLWYIYQSSRASRSFFRVVPGASSSVWKETVVAMPL